MKIDDQIKTIGISDNVVKTSNELVNVYHHGKFSIDVNFETKFMKKYNIFEESINSWVYSSPNVENMIDLNLYCNLQTLYINRVRFSNIVIPQIDSLIQLTVHSNFESLTVLPNLPNLRYLSCSCNDVDVIPYYEKLEVLFCMNFVKHITEGSPNLKYINCENCELEEIGYFPSLEVLVCGNNKIKTINGDMQKLEEIHCRNNNITDLTGFPELWMLDCHKNPIENIDVEKLICLECNGDVINCVKKKGTIISIKLHNNVNINELTEFSNIVFLYLRDVTNLSITGLDNLKKISLCECDVTINIPSISTLRSDHSIIRVVCNTPNLACVDEYCKNDYIQVTESFLEKYKLITGKNID